VVYDITTCKCLISLLKKDEKIVKKVLLFVPETTIITVLRKELGNDKRN